MSAEKSKEEKNKDLVARMYEALNKTVIGLMPEFWTKDMSWYGPAGIGTLHGVEEFDEALRPFNHAFPDKVARDEIRIAEGDYVAAHGYQHATHTGDWLGIPASGKSVKIRYMDFWHVKGDKLAENWVLIDILDFLEQLGYDIDKVLAFIGSKPPEFFDGVETD
ncbi:ester cyclase [Candidatus Leptofilum sp.]|uniref:ester cyclase n=1 Tax=Candidatus Leptofilum sp. TaxID=3241576 RepID=UPI003B5ADF2F